MSAPSVPAQFPLPQNKVYMLSSMSNSSSALSKEAKAPAADDLSTRSERRPHRHKVESQSMRSSRHDPEKEKHREERRAQRERERLVQARADAAASPKPNSLPVLPLSPAEPEQKQLHEIFSADFNRPLSSRSQESSRSHRIVQTSSSAEVPSVSVTPSTPASSARREKQHGKHKAKGKTADSDSFSD